MASDYPTCWPGKWKGHPGWTVREGCGPEMLTVDELLRLWRAVPQGRDAMTRALGVSHLSNRKADRALQLLRREGLVRFNRETRQWQVSA